MMEHWFWLALAAAVVVWYSTITVYVAVRGTLDIKDMLQRLKASHEEKSATDAGQQPPSGG